MNFKPLEEFLDYITQWRIPGADCVVYHRNTPVFRYSAGYADVATKRPVTPDTLYFLYSCTKVITCTAAVQLLERGKFLLNDPVSEYLPEFGEMYIKQGDSDAIRAQNPITVGDLFSMTAGLTYNLKSSAINEVRERTQGKCPTREIARAIAKEPILFEPGTHWSYSLCHDVLGALVEVVSGQRFSTYVEENILRPLGMNDTGFRLTEEKKKRMSTQYRFDDEKGAAIEVPLENEHMLGSEYDSGGAGLVASVDDYIKFANALCHHGRQPGGERILSPAAVDLMRTNRLSDSIRGDINWVQLSGYGYGLGVRTMINRAAGGSLSPVGEFGWGGAAGAYAMIDPDNQVAVFYAQHLLNSQEPRVHPRLRNIVYGCLEL